MKDNIMNKISGRWVSERELALEFNLGINCEPGTTNQSQLLTSKVRRKITQSRHPAGAAVVLGAKSVHIIWSLESSAGLLARDSQTIVAESIQWFEDLLHDSANKDKNADLAAKKILITARYADSAEISHDLEKLAGENKISATEILQRHLATTYVVAFCGFQPGFAYLEALPGSPKIKALRHDTPRAKVPAGAIALGGPYCGIYPADGPGGWNIIGLTAMRFIDPLNGQEVWQPGDLVQFVEEVK